MGRWEGGKTVEAGKDGEGGKRQKQRGKPEAKRLEVKRWKQRGSRQQSRKAESWGKAAEGGKVGKR